jgi:hypothetical protein
MRWKSGVLFGGVIALCGITARSQTIGRDVTGPHQSPASDGHPAIYVARVMAVSATGKDVFFCLHETERRLFVASIKARWLAN